jgi:hypothetical protein
LISHFNLNNSHELQHELTPLYNQPPGTVPLYWGSDSSNTLMPGDHAVIRIDDFPTIKDMTGAFAVVVV